MPSSPTRPHRPALLGRVRQTGVQFIKFGTVGLIGFVFDTGTVYALRGPLGIYGAGLAAYAVAATVAWICNRLWTFRGRSTGPAYREWARYLSANLSGFALNRGTFVALVALVPLCATHPVLAVAAGAVAGMFVNFGLSRHLVFREET